MASTLRTLISGDKRRYKEDGFNLDLTYITPRLIAMGLPGKGVSTLWRNRVEEVGKFLEQNHSGHYKIFSLGKSASDFFGIRNNAAWFGWSSKKAPPLELLNRILLAINDWLAASPQNVAVIHCKEGRERSGVVIASYLVKSGVYATAQEALNFYASMRSKQHEGVQTPSQIRYVNYISSVSYLPPPRKIHLRRIVMRPVPEYHNFQPIIDVLNSSVVPAQTILNMKDPKAYEKLDFNVPIELNCPIQGDTYIQISHRPHILGLGPKSNSLLFRVGFNTAFVPDRWVLTKNELDGEFAGPVADTKLRKGFTVELLFTEGPFDPLPADPNAVPQVIQQPLQQPIQYRDVTPEQHASETIPVHMEGQASNMEWYHPAPDSHIVTEQSAPPPINRSTKDNRVALDNATDAVARATERLRAASFSMPGGSSAIAPSQFQPPLSTVEETKDSSEYQSNLPPSQINHT